MFSVEFGAGKINLNDIDIRLKIWDTVTNKNHKFKYIGWIRVLSIYHTLVLSWVSYYIRINFHV